MIEAICNSLTKKIIKSVDGYDENKADEINFGLQLLIGEVPKFFITFILAWILNIIDLTIISFIVILPYRMFSGGFHLRTHLGCIIATNTMYIGSAYLASILNFDNTIKYILIAITFIFSFAMIAKYAPADTEDVPILRKKERSIKKNLSYITMTLTLVASIIVKDTVLSNLLIFLTIFQTIWISKFTYKITNNKYGYEEYVKLKNVT